MISLGRSRRGLELTFFLVIMMVLGAFAAPPSHNPFVSAVKPDITRAGNNTTINQPPRILTDELPPMMKGEEYSFPMEAVDDTTPAEFLTWSLEYYAYDYDYKLVMYMEGNILKGGPHLDIGSDIEITIKVVDVEGDSSERTYEIEVDWTNEPPQLLKYPQRIDITSNEIYLSVGTGNLSDIQYFEPEEEDIYIREDSISESWCDTYYDRSRGRLRIYRNYNRWGPVDVTLRLEDEMYNDVEFTIKVEFFGYEASGDDHFFIYEFGDGSGYQDDTVMVFGIGMKGLEGPLFHNISVDDWEVDGTQVEYDEPIARILLEPGIYNLSVRFTSNDLSYSDEFMVYKEIEVKPSGMRDVSDEKEPHEGSLLNELIFLGIVLPILIFLPMVVLYIFFAFRRRMTEGGDEE